MKKKKTKKTQRPVVRSTDLLGGVLECASLSSSLFSSGSHSQMVVSSYVEDREVQWIEIDRDAYMQSQSFLKQRAGIPLYQALEIVNQFAIERYKQLPELAQYGHTCDRDQKSMTAVRVLWKPK